MSAESKQAEMRRGVVVLVVLAALTALEYILATALSLWGALALIALVKGAIVLVYFMHLPRVFSKDGGH